MERVELRKVSLLYDGRASIAELSVVVEGGEHTAVIGPSGGGKSTLLRVVAGLETPTTGEVLFDGEVVSRAGQIIRPPHLRELSMVFQDLALWPNLSALENVVLGLAGARLSREERRTRASEALTLCRVESLAGRRPGTLSGGEQQRVALARALATRPRFLLLDEPFSGLDLVTKRALLEEIRSLAQDRGVTLVLVTHDPLEIKSICTSALVIAAGKLEEAGRLWVSATRRGRGRSGRSRRCCEFGAGSKRPHMLEQGHYDRLGNVYDWCEDLYVAEFYSNPETRKRSPLCTSGSANQVCRYRCSSKSGVEKISASPHIVSPVTRLA